jgi:hypothetical protein
MRNSHVMTPGIVGLALLVASNVRVTVVNP